MSEVPEVVENEGGENEVVEESGGVLEGEEQEEVVESEGGVLEGDGEEGEVVESGEQVENEVVEEEQLQGEVEEGEQQEEGENQVEEAEKRVQEQVQKESYFSFLVCTLGKCTGAYTERNSDLFFRYAYDFYEVPQCYTSSMKQRLLERMLFISSSVLDNLRENASTLAMYLQTFRPQAVHFRTIRQFILFTLLKDKLNYTHPIQTTFSEELEQDERLKLLEEDSFQQLLRGEKVSYNDFKEDQESLVLTVTQYQPYINSIDI